MARIIVTSNCGDDPARRLSKTGIGAANIIGALHKRLYYILLNSTRRMIAMFSIFLAIPTNVFLVIAVVAQWFPTPFVFTVAAISVLFIELLKTLFLATHQGKAVAEFGASLALLLILSLYIQSQSGWGQNNLTVCALIQFFDTVGGFIGTFLLARRDFGRP